MISSMKKSTLILIFLASFSLISTTKAAILLPASETPEAQIKNAVHEYHNLSKSEKKDRIAKVKTAIKNHKSKLKNGGSIDDDALLAIIFAILIPPIGVVLHENKVTTKFWISLLLTLIFWLPGMIYSLLVVTDNA